MLSFKKKEITNFKSNIFLSCLSNCVRNFLLPGLLSPCSSFWSFLEVITLLELSWSKYGSSIIVNFLLFYINNYRVSKHFFSFPHRFILFLVIFLWLWLLLVIAYIICLGVFYCSQILLQFVAFLESVPQIWTQSPDMPK